MQTPSKERISHKRIKSFKQNNVIPAKPKYVKSDNSQIHPHLNKGGQITALKVLKKYSFVSDIFKKKKTETRETASILRKAPNTWKVQNKRYLLGQKHNLLPLANLRQKLLEWVWKTPAFNLGMAM